VAQLVCSHGFGGVERYAATLAAELTRLPDGPEVVVVGGARGPVEAVLAGTPATWLPGSSVAEAARSLASAGAGLDLVHAHMTQAELVATGLAALGAAGLRRTPVVGTRHFARPRGSTPLARLAGRWVARRLAAEVAVSHHTAAYADHALVVHSGVAPVPEADLPREPAVLVAQRLAAEKATDVALRAWARARARHAGWRLWVAGSGPCEAELRRLAQDLGIGDEVDFLGRRTDLPDWYRRASVLLAPTPVEGFGLTVVEAMAHGLPVVAAGAGGHLETLGGPGRRWTFPPGDAARAAGLVDALAADPSARDRLGRALRERQRARFTLHRQARETLAFYERLLGRTVARR